MDLQRVPAVRKFASLEPLLGPIVIPERSGLDWVIVGGESGPEHRPMDPEWVRSIRDQCTQLFEQDVVPASDTVFL